MPVSKSAARNRNKTAMDLRWKFFNTPDVFNRDWNLKMEVWRSEICRRAERLRDHNGRKTESVFVFGFGMIEKARDILRRCGVEIYNAYANSAEIDLVAECYKAVGRSFDSTHPVTHSALYYKPPGIFQRRF